jgi:hypothetical protein
MLILQPVVRKANPLTIGLKKWQEPKDQTRADEVHDYQGTNTNPLENIAVSLCIAARSVNRDNGIRSRMANHTPKGKDRMAVIGRLGGLKSADVRRQRLSTLERRLLGTVAARARWGKPKWSLAEEAAWREGWLAGYLRMTGWPRDRRPNRVFVKPAE